MLTCICNLKTQLQFSTQFAISKGATTFTITTLSIMGLFATLSINDIKHTSIECRDAEFRYAECQDFLNIMLGVVMLNAVMPSVVAHF
jgi:hypothetical protein